MLTEHDLRIKAGLQIISADSVHVLYDNMSHPPGFNIGKQPLPRRTVKVASKHLKNIFESGELLEESVVSKMETTAADGKR